MKEKFVSGRFWLTIITGGVFAYCACKGTIDSQATAAIIVSVFTSYFQRSDRNGKSEVK